MTQKNKTNCRTQKSKILFFVLVLCIILLTPSVVKAKPSCSRKCPPSKTFRSMARIYMAYGQYTKAQTLAEYALSLARTQNASDSELSLCLIDLAWLYTKQGRFAEAEKMCKSGLKLQKKAYCENHPYVAYTLRNLASIYQEQGKYNQATSALDRAMAIMLDYHTPQDPIIAPFQVDIAKLLVEQRKFTEAQTRYHKALDIINKSYGPEHLYTAGVLGNLARLYTLQGRYSKAEALITKTLRAQEKVYGADHHFLAPAWLTMADICKAKGENAQAEKLIQKALAAVKKTGNDAAIAKLQQRATEILATKQVAFAPVAKKVVK